ncbi:hypothetical protein [Paenibacillus illinoisensis]|uniref:Uncharacterized protein n=1 Tax=Paenibacillus illinoisensis TaxID=59845 RepID=A0A2W0C6F4_9BACL|nr:hypothetical protein [Paenibacillus illinoisensis]PYY28313.1 hypothetical protein PIL02S_03464 [Paenibacillus illinoisensis]
MYQVVVVEKIFGKIEVNTYGFPTEVQRDIFKELCEEDDVIIITREEVAV